MGRRRLQTETLQEPNIRRARLEKPESRFRGAAVERGREPERGPTEKIAEDWI
jgi:hypothetical protein